MVLIPKYAERRHVMATFAGKRRCPVVCMCGGRCGIYVDSWATSPLDEILMLVGFTPYNESALVFTPHGGVHDFACTCAQDAVKARPARP